MVSCRVPPPPTSQPQQPAVASMASSSGGSSPIWLSPESATIVLSHERVDRSLCLVVSMPLGVSRVGSYQGDLPALGEAPRSTLCRPRIQEG